MPQSRTVSEPYFPVHAHSEFSVLDGMGTVRDMALTVADHGQPGLALTDHGNMAGALRLYKECRKLDITPFPGEEFYVVADATPPAEKLPKGVMDIRAQRWHLGIVALNLNGYRALIKLSSLSHSRERFWRKPLIDYSDLAELGKAHGGDVAVTTGCYFGVLIQTILNSPTPVDTGTAVIRQFRSMGFQHLFVELQNHNIQHNDERAHQLGIEHDLDLSAALHQIAVDTGTPVVVGQDSHYCDAYDKAAHDTMKDIAYLGGSGEDNRFPGDSFHLADTGWIKDHWLPEQWDDAMAGHQQLLDLNTLKIPELDSYKFHVPWVAKDPDTVLADKVSDAFTQHDRRGDPVYADRITEELSVIRAKGMAGYFLLVADYMQWCRDEGIFVNARGSANGSLICYLLGITNIDPVEWGTDFGRFLSLDRAKPPDIDVDIESDRREDVIAYIRSRYPELTQLGTWLRLGVTDEDTGKGSVYVQWHAAQRAKGTPQQSIPPNVMRDLKNLSLMDVRKSPGAHAGGFVLPGEGLAVSDLIPTMLIPSSGHTVTQAPMDDVEEAGYVKIDLLGLRSLSTMRRVMELIGKDPITDGMDWIPNNDREACRMLRSGQTENGIFQFEGFSTAKGARKMGVRSTDDAILALALFRPAMMNSGMTDRYLEARKTKAREVIDPTVDDLFDRTWGVPVFQEDVLELMKRSGLSVDHRNEVLKAVKASNDKIAEYALAIFDRIGKVFVRSATVTLGVSVDTARKMWRTVMDFSDYGFNRAHATAYGLMGYRMAYLKAHHPLEFMAALLETWAGTTKEAQYIKEARRMGLKIRRPDVNLSGVSWCIDRSDGVLVKGLVTIKGVGYRVAEAIVDERQNGDYVSLDDFCKRSGVTGSKPLLKDPTDWKGTMLVLRDASALRTLGVTA